MEMNIEKKEGKKEKEKMTFEGIVWWCVANEQTNQRKKKDKWTDAQRTRECIQTWIKYMREHGTGDEVMVNGKWFITTGGWCLLSGVMIDSKTPVCFSHKILSTILNWMRLDACRSFFCSNMCIVVCITSFVRAVFRLDAFTSQKWFATNCDQLEFFPAPPHHK